MGWDGMDRPVHHGRCLSPHPQMLDHRHPPSSRKRELHAFGEVQADSFSTKNFASEGDVVTIGLKRHRDPFKSSVS